MVNDVDLAATLDSFGKDQLAHPTTKAPVRNLMINMPPRHAKSTFCTELFPAWYMLRDPRRFIMTTSYNNDLARGFGQNVLANVKHPEAQKAFTDFALNPKRQAPQEWATEAGGVYYGIGVGGTTVGRAANLLIIDDPIRSREEAESPTMRNKVWDFYVGSLSTRMQPEVNDLVWSIGFQQARTASKHRQPNQRDGDNRPVPRQQPCLVNLVPQQKDHHGHDQTGQQDALIQVFQQEQLLLPRGLSRYRWPIQGRHVTGVLHRSPRPPGSSSGRPRADRPDRGQGTPRYRRMRPSPISLSEPAPAAAPRIR